MPKKWIRYITKTVIAFAALWILLLAIAFVYIELNKEAIVSSVRVSLNKKITGAIDFKSLTIDLFNNFPGISIDVKNVHIKDSLFNRHRKELLSANVISMGFGLIDLVFGRKTPKYVTISNATLLFFADSTGQKNWHILRKGESRSSKLPLKKIKFKNVNAFFQDVSKQKFYNMWFEKMKCNLEDHINTIDVQMEVKGTIKSAFFNTKQGSYLTNKKLVCELKMAYERPLKKISFKNENVRLNRQSYRVTGDFYFDHQPRFTLIIRAPSVALKEAASIFPQRTATKIGKFELSKPLGKLEAFVSGEMKYRSFPLAKISFVVSDATLKISPTSFQRCSFNAFFQNEIDSSKPRDDRNSLLRFANVRGEWEQNPFDGKTVTVYNLIHPYLKCDIHTVFDLARLEKAIGSRRLDFNGGKGEASVNYAGPLETRADTSYELVGNINIHNGDITYNARKLDFKQTDIDLKFMRGGDLVVKRMNTVLNNNKIEISGRVDNFLNFFNTDPSKAVFNWDIYSPSIDVSKLRSSLRRSVALTKSKQGYSFFERLNNKIDRLFDACNAYLDVKADEVIYKNFTARKVKGYLTLTNDIVKLSDFALSHAGGFIQLNAFSKDNGNNNDLSLQSKMQGVDVKELFAAFNNFGMEALTSRNISGTFSADVNLTSMLNANGDLLKAANRGYVDFSLKNGRLENFRPLMDIDNNFLQKRDLSDVRFSELKDRLDLDGEDIHVNRMEIRSTAVSMYVEGTYSFGANTDLSIQIPLKDQKKDRVIAPQNKGVKAKTGLSIFLRAKDDKDGKLKITYDLFGRFRNKG